MILRSFLIMQDNYPPYFLQTRDWLDFWKQASGSGHDFQLFEKGCLQAYIYEYPWHLGQKLWYLPKAPVLVDSQYCDKESIERNFQQLIQQVIEQAAKSSISHIKIDFDDTISNLIGLHTPKDFESYLRLKMPNLKNQLNLKARKIQYLQCTVCKIKDLIKPEADQNLVDFYNNTGEFWATTSERVRRYSRKTLKLLEEGRYTVSTDKSEDNFAAFWKVHKHTADRQGFGTQSLEYLRQMCFSPMGRIIIIRDMEGRPQTVWLGVADSSTLYYLCGGNTDLALKEHLQYLLHIAALKLARLNGLQYYDMGGYDPKSGYGQFKDGYRGRLREFVGPVDIIINPTVYFPIHTLLNLKNKLTAS